MKALLHFSTSRRATLGAIVLSAAIGYAARDAIAQETPQPIVDALLARQLEDVGGRQLAVTKLTYPPGASSMPHRHAAYLAVYVLSGQVESALDDGEPIVYGPGDVWYEGHGQLHRVFRNPSSTEPFTALVFALRDADHPANVREPGAHGR